MRWAAQSTLTAFLVTCGLLLVICVAPPSAWWSRGEVTAGASWRPTALAVGLLVVFVVIDATPALRSIFALLQLDPLDWALVVVAVAAWLFLVRAASRFRLLSRYLDRALDDPMLKGRGGDG
jgi:hypothetical protein